MITVESQVLENLVHLYRTELLEVGYDTATITDNRQLLISYHTIKKRLIPQHPRQVHYANNFTCPTTLQNGLDLLTDKFERGMDLRPHLSKTVNRINTEDKLLYSWNIHHFHLGVTTTEDGFIQHTENVLFAVVTPCDVYYLCIMDHKNWSNIALVQTIHNNWSELISDFKVEGEFCTIFDSQDVAKLRKANINVGITMQDGTGYLPMGMGFTGAGHSAQATLDSIYEIKRIKRLEQAIQNEDESLFHNCPPDLLNQFKQNGIILQMRQNLHALVAYDSISNQDIAKVSHNTLQEDMKSAF